MTNGEKIRNMSDDELSAFLLRTTHCDYWCPAYRFCRSDEALNLIDCDSIFRAWVKKEAKDDEC